MLLSVCFFLRICPTMQATDAVYIRLLKSELREAARALRYLTPLIFDH